MERKFTRTQKLIDFDEASLLSKSAVGDQAAFSQLYLHYYPKIFRFINGMLNSKEDSEEILQDMFVEIFESKENLLQIKSFNSYLYKIAKYKLINLHEHRLVEQKAARYLKNTMDISSRAADEDLILKQYQNVYSAAVNLLPEKRRTVFEMKNIQELSHDEIAIELKISKSMVKKQCYAATKHIRLYLLQHIGLITPSLLAPLFTWFFPF